MFWLASYAMNEAKESTSKSLSVANGSYVAEQVAQQLEENLSAGNFPFFLISIKDLDIV